MRLIFFCIAILSFGLVHASDSEEWTHLYDEQGVSVFENKSAVFPQYKATGRLNLNFYDVVAVMSDIPRRLEWVENLSEIKVLEGDTLSHILVYNRFDLPWPAADRDSIVEALIEVDSTAKTAEIHFKSQNETSIHEYPGVVRVKTVLGITRLKYIDENTTEVSDQILMDPGGYLPKWIAKIFIEDVPVHTLSALKKQVQKTRGQYEGYIARIKLQTDIRAQPFKGEVKK